MSGEFTDLFAALACGAVVAAAEAVKIPLLRRAAIIGAGRLRGDQGRASREVQVALRRSLTVLGELVDMGRDGTLVKQPVCHGVITTRAAHYVITTKAP